MHWQGNKNVASKRPRTEDDLASSVSLLPLEDMTNPRAQLEIREVILASSRDNSCTIRISTNILFIHSKQLLSAARDVEGPLILDCCKGAMSVLDQLFWAPEWKHVVPRLTHEELLNLVEVAQMWQIDVVTDAMPAFISSRDWHTEQEQSALADLYARSYLGSNLYQAALLELIKAAKAKPSELLRLVPRPQVGHLSRVLESLTLVGAVEYLNGAQLPLISFGLASTLLPHLDKMAATCARKGRAGQLDLVDALHLQAVEDTSKLQCKLVTYFTDHEAVGIICSSFDRCIKDMLHHYLREAIQYQHGARSWPRQWGGRLA